MAYPDYIKVRARELRVTKALSVDEIAERLALPKTTVYSWIVDLPLGRPRRGTPGQQKGNEAMQAKYRKLREDAYAEGTHEYEQFVLRPTFREFVSLYIAEGYKRNRNVVSIANSDDRVIALADSWLRRLTAKTLTYTLQYHVDQDLDEIRLHWGELLDIDGDLIRMQRKSNSGQLKGRTWRSQFGVLTIWAGDTLLRARLQAWIDRLKDEWRLHSAAMRGA